jgi:hypothetical protein
MAGLSFKDWNSRMDLFAAQQDVTDDEEDEDSVWTPAYGFPYSSEDNLFLASAELSGECSRIFGVTALGFTAAPPGPCSGQQRIREIFFVFSISKVSQTKYQKRKYGKRAHQHLK